MKKNIFLAYIGFFTLVFVLFLLTPLYKLIITSVMLSYLMFPTKKFLMKYIKSKNATAFLCTFIWISILVVFMGFLINVLIKGVVELGEFVRSDEFLIITEYTQNLIKENEVLKAFAADLDLASIVNFISSYIQRLVISTPSFIFDFVALILFSFYIVRDSDSFFKFILEIFEEKNKALISQIYKEIDAILKGIFYGHIITALVLSLIPFVFFLIFKVPNPFLLFIVTFIVSLFPLGGGAMVCLITSIIYIASQNYFTGISFLIVAVILSFTDNIVRPIVSNNKVNIHPLLFLFGFFTGPNIFGPLGMLIGPMIMGVLQVTIDDFVQLILKKKLNI